MNTYFVTGTYRYGNGALDGRFEYVIQSRLITDEDSYQALRRTIDQKIYERHEKPFSNVQIHCLSKL